MKKKSKKPKPRGVWKINPKTRVAPGKKQYSREEEKKRIRAILSKIDWFGEKT